MTILWDRDIVIRISVLFMGRDPVELSKRAKYKPPAMRVPMASTSPSNWQAVFCIKKSAEIPLYYSTQFSLRMLPHKTNRKQRSKVFFHKSHL